MSLQMRSIRGISRGLVKPLLGRLGVGTASRGRLIFRTLVEPFFLKPRGFWQKRGELGGIQGLWCGAGLPRKSVANGVIFYVHGGCFCFGSPESHVHLAADLAGHTGRVAFLPRYRLAPEHPFPAGRDDVFTAYKGLLAEHPGVDVVLAGDSAGGNLALLCLAQALADGAPLPQGVAALSPITDLTHSGASIVTNAQSEDFLPIKSLGALQSAYLRGHPGDDPRASPHFADFTGAPPVLTLASDSEILLDDAKRLHDRLQNAQVESRLEIYANCIHAWPMMRGPMPEANAAITQLAQFIRGLSA